MGTQIIPQPDGKLSLFSTVTETFIATDMTDEQVIEWFVGEAATRAERQAREEIVWVRDPSNRKPYFQFTFTYEAAVLRDRMRRGDDDAQ